MALRFDHVTVRLDDRTVLSVPSLSVEPGERVAVVGPAAAGKSVLLSVVAGERTPSEGTVTLEGHPVHGPREDVARVSPEEVSTSDARVLLLDEPLGDAEATARDAARNRLRDDLVASGATTVVATADQEDALTLADRLVLLADGTVHQVGPTRSLIERPATTAVASFFGRPPMNVVPGILEKDGVAVEIGPRTLALPGVIEETYARDIFLGIRPEHVELGFEPTGGWQGRVSDVGRVPGGSTVTVDVDMGVFVARVDGAVPCRVGDAVSLTLPSRHLHVFDERGGRLEIV